MKSFDGVSRVEISDPPEIAGRTGVVIRRRWNDDGAWVDVADGLPDKLRSFSADDEHGRGNHIVLYPEQCKPLTE